MQNFMNNSTLLVVSSVQKQMNQSRKNEIHLNWRKDKVREMRLR